MKSQNLTGANILIRVIRAFNVPVKEDIDFVPNDVPNDPVSLSASVATPFGKVV